MDYITELVSFALATVLFLYAALSPLHEGRPVNLLFLGLAVVAIVLFVIFYRKSRHLSGVN